MREETDPVFFFCFLAAAQEGEEAVDADANEQMHTSRKHAHLLLGCIVEAHDLVAYVCAHTGEHVMEPKRT